MAGNDHVTFGYDAPFKLRVDSSRDSGGDHRKLFVFKDQQSYETGYDDNDRLYHQRSIHVYYAVDPYNAVFFCLLLYLFSADIRFYQSADGRIHLFL